MNKKDLTTGYACLNCRKTFKKFEDCNQSIGSKSEQQAQFKCPQCSSIMFETGSAFKAPKSSNIKEWEKLKPFFEGGYKFHPDSGNPFEDRSTIKKKKTVVSASVFRKPVRKRNK